MNGQGAEFVEIFLQEASERLQFLREYSGILQRRVSASRKMWSACTLRHTRLPAPLLRMVFRCFAEISGKLAHIFQYAMNATIAADAAGPLVEFISEAVALLESDLIMISTNGGGIWRRYWRLQAALSICVPDFGCCRSRKNGHSRRLRTDS